MTKTISLWTALSAILISGLFLFAFTSTPNASAASSLFGGATMAAGEVTLVSDLGDAGAGNDFSGISFDDMNGQLFSSLATLSSDYNVTDDDCGAGSPRFSIRLDENGNSVDDAGDGNIFVYFGPSPSFTDCAAGWQSTGNLIGNNDAGRWDSGQITGGVNSGTYAQALAAAGNMNILRISIVVDSGWNAGAANGADQEQTILIDNVALNNASYNFSPQPVTVTIVKYVDGQHATAQNASSTSFPMISSWDDANNGGVGNGTYALSTTGFNTPNAYEAVTSDMANGSDYTTEEDITTAVVGPNCASGQAYELVGYTTGDTLVEAQNASPTLTIPAFTDIMSDKYVIVWNKPCAVVPPPTPVQNACATPTVAPAGYTLQNGTMGSDNVTLAPNTMFVGKGGHDKVKGPDGDYIVCTESGNDVISLGNGNSEIDAGDGNNKVTTGNGMGKVTVGSGNDVITVGTGDHTIDAGSGNNVVTTGNGTQNVTTGGGNDKITTGNGDDMINAGAGNNTVQSGGGNDSVTALNGNDVINGGAGASDTCSAGTGSNTVTNCEL